MSMTFIAFLFLANFVIFLLLVLCRSGIMSRKSLNLYFLLFVYCSRVIKSQAEIEVLRYVAKVSSDAHKAVMKSIK